MDDTLTPQPHKVDQPGLRGHSHQPEDDLMKRFLVLEARPGRIGYLGVASYTDHTDALDYVADHKSAAEGNHFRIEDQSGPWRD